MRLRKKKKTKKELSPKAKRSGAEKRGGEFFGQKPGCNAKRGERGRSPKPSNTQAGDRHLPTTAWANVLRAAKKRRKRRNTKG